MVKLVLGRRHTFTKTFNSQEVDTIYSLPISKMRVKDRISRHLQKMKNIQLKVSIILSYQEKRN